MSLTIIDIARMANTSTATISRVMSGKPGVSEEKRKDIVELLDRLGYRPNRIAQQLALGRSNLLGVVVNNLKIPLHAQLIGSLENCCGEYGYNLLVMDSNHDPEKEINNIETMRGQRVGGLFIVPVHEYDTRVSLDHLLRLKLDKYPFVIIGKVPGFDFDWVAIEESDAASMTAQYLLNLGHKYFCLLGYDANNRTVVERFDSISATLLQHQVEIEKDLIVEEVGTWVNGGMLSWRCEVDRIMSREKRPTAFITANDTIALVTIRELETLGYSVPGDISVVGFDNSDFSALTHPAITTNAKSMEDLARLATEILIGKLDDPNRKSVQSEIPQKLIERDSCGPCTESLR
jgi:LacI family transcriptional regulator, repressor for deo operon, udp, cdd, tsx, nupC, and nupG